jgi:hypothetical protein
MGEKGKEREGEGEDKGKGTEGEMKRGNLASWL